VEYRWDFGDGTFATVTSPQSRSRITAARRLSASPWCRLSDRLTGPDDGGSRGGRRPATSWNPFPGIA
jgi:hypothetical protein